MSGPELADQVEPAPRASLWWWVSRSIVGLILVAMVLVGFTAVRFASEIRGQGDERIDDRLPEVQAAVENLIRPFDPDAEVSAVPSCNGDWTGNVSVVISADESRSSETAEAITKAASMAGWRLRSSPFHEQDQLQRDFSGVPFDLEILPTSASGAGPGTLFIRSAFAGMEDCG